MFCDYRGDFVYLKSDSLDLLGALVCSSEHGRTVSARNKSISVKRGSGAAMEGQNLHRRCNALKRCLVVSQGHMVSLDTCVALVRRLTFYKACEPVRRGVKLCLRNTTSHVCRVFDLFLSFLRSV